MSRHIEVLLPPPYHKGGRSCTKATPWEMTNPLTDLEISDEDWEKFIGKVFKTWAAYTWGTVCDILVCMSVIGIPFLYGKEARALEHAQRVIMANARADLNCDVRCTRTSVTEMVGVVQKLVVTFTPVYQYRDSIKFCFTPVVVGRYIGGSFWRGSTSSDAVDLETAGMRDSRRVESKSNHRASKKSFGPPKAASTEGKPRNIATNQSSDHVVQKADTEENTTATESDAANPQEQTDFPQLNTDDGLDNTLDDPQPVGQQSRPSTEGESASPPHRRGSMAMGPRSKSPSTVVRSGLRLQTRVAPQKLTLITDVD